MCLLDDRNVHLMPEWRIDTSKKPQPFFSYFIQSRAFYP